jgi:hypothetical protein
MDAHDEKRVTIQEKINMDKESLVLSIAIAAARLI